MYIAVCIQKHCKAGLPSILRLIRACHIEEPRASLLIALYTGISLTLR